MSKSINLKGCKVLSITSPARIAGIAEEKGINPQEVFVRLTFSKGKSTYTVSNKLRIIGQKDYELLRSKVDTEEKVDLVITQSDTNPENMFFYLDKNVSVADLFKEKVESKNNTRTSLMKLFS